MSRPAIVIGSGPNGLSAAIRLAEAGLDVLVLEAADTPGGAVRTAELTLPGFHHDVFSAVYPAGAASPVFGRMPLAEHGLEWVHPEICAAHPLPGGQGVALHRDVEATAASLDRVHPGDGDAWRSFVTPLLDSWDAVRATMLSGFPPLRGPVKLLAQGGPLGLARFAALLPGTARGLAHRLFGGPGNRAWLYGAAAHGDVPPSGLGSAIAAVYLDLMGHAVGWPSPRGGAAGLTGALVSYLRSLGGDVRTGAAAARVLHRGGRVTGVELADGERLPAEVVVADVMPHALSAMAGDAFRGPYRALLHRYAYGPATLKLDWALDGPIPWTDPALRQAGTVHVGGSEDELVATLDHAATRLPERPFMLLGQQSVADPTRAPAGKHTVWAYTHGPRDGVDWLAEQERHADRMEAHVEAYAPGFRDRILARHVMGPADLQARNRNLVDGDVGGGSYRLPQVVFRPLPSVSPYRTPLRGLYLGSAAAFPGAAVHGVPGDAAARAALGDRRPLGRALRLPG